MSGNWPDFDAWLQTAWGAENSFFSTCGQGGSIGFIFGQNPPYYLDDFLSIYPKFFGAPTSVTSAAITAGSNVITLADTAGLGYGQFLQGTGLAKGTVITALGTGSITVNQPALADGTGVTLQVYENPPVPVAVAQLYINLALASLVQARWEDSWYIAVAWFVAHYLTLYAKSDSVDISSGVGVAAQGLALGIQTSKSVGDVSVGYTVLAALEDWAAWNLTLYGQHLSTMARVVGSGPVLIR
jgi:hypothetical protein